MNAGVVSLLWVLVGVVLLVAMIVKFKINSIIALILSAIFIALADGISVGDLVTTMEDGLGGTLKSLALIIIFGAAIGKLMTIRVPRSRLPTLSLTSSVLSCCLLRF